MDTSDWIALLNTLVGLIPLLLPVAGFLRKRKSGGRTGRRTRIRQMGIADPPGGVKAVRNAAVVQVLESIGGASPAVRVGYWFAVLAAFCWSLGNIGFRWSASRVPGSNFEIAVINYAVAGLTLIVWGATMRRSEETRGPILFPALPRFLAASFFKSLNTYCWILSVSFIPAAFASTLENLHVVWAALALMLVFGIQLPKVWMYGSVLVLVGGALVTRVAVYGFAGIHTFGFAAALLSGLAFAAFYLLWTGQGSRPRARSERAIEMGGVLSMALVFLFPIHMLASAIWPSYVGALFGRLPVPDLWMQAANGIIGIGLTYLLIAEALHRMRSVGAAGSFLLGFAMSSAVPLTLLLEVVILGVPAEPSQWVGAAMFSFGFIFVAGEIGVPGSDPSFFKTVNDLG
jgi:drug/metabolite transporter (DMT)-like permease